MFRALRNRQRARGATRRQQDNTMPVLPQWRAWLVVALITSVIVLGWQYRDSLQGKVMTVENVGIDGQFVQLSPQQAAEVIAQHLDGDYFTLDLERIRSALLAMPWVQEVSVRRRWPSELIVTIEEKQPIAWWGEKQLLSDRKQVFTPDFVTELPPLPRLQGPAGLHATVWEFYSKLSAELNNHDRRIHQLALDQRRSWQLVLDNELVIKLGRSDIANRLQRLYKVFAIARAIELETVEQIDMRYPNGFAARYRQADEPAGETALYNNREGSTGTRVHEV